MIDETTQPSPANAQDFASLLQARALELAAPARSESNITRDATHVCFEAGGIRFAVTSTAVVRVLADARISRIPGAPARLDRVLFVDGRIVSIADPAALVDRTVTPTVRPRVLLLEHLDGRLALFVDSLPRLDAIETGDVTNAPDDRRNPFVLGTTRSLTVILDTHALVASLRDHVGM